MSSLAATQADGYYRDPGTGEREKAAPNQFARSGIVRFELPEHGSCLSCRARLARGTKFNAKKKDTGTNYLSTKIWAFITKCHFCGNELEVRTDPKTAGYSYVRGIRMQTLDEEDQVIVVQSGAKTDAMGLLEKEAVELSREHERLNALISLQRSRKTDDAGANSVLRSLNRGKRRRAAELTNEGLRRGLKIPLVEENSDDALLAKRVFLSRVTEVVPSRPPLEQDIFAKSSKVYRELHPVHNPR